jgi:hypothetical protein
VWIEVSEYLGAYVGVGEGIFLLYQSSCGRMRMVRASGYRAQCSALTIA